MTEHHLAVSRTARYYTLGGNQTGQLTDEVTHLWIVLHGYGQLAKYFIRKFDVIADEHTLVVAPEGLSRLYLDAEYGRMGASWMTREDKEYEIGDYVAYLDQLYQTILQGRDPATLQVTLMGFSQGCATACRWLNRGEIRCDRLLLWAGYFANGLMDVLSPETARAVPITYIYGRQDEYIEQMPDPEAYLVRLQADIPHMPLVAFDGKHVVDREVLQRFK